MSVARRFRNLIFVSLLAIAATTALTAQTASTAKKPALDDKQVLAGARAAYYNLADHGFTGVRCDLTPDWKKLLGNVDAEKSAQRAEQLSHLKFGVVVNASGAAIVNHSLGENSGELDPAMVKQMFDGMDQMIGGVFQSWSPFMTGGILPPDSIPVKVERNGAVYKLTYKDGDSAITTLVDQDYRITELDVVNPQLHATMHPQFQKTPGGYVLTSFDSNFREAGAQADSLLTAHLTNQDVSTFVFPAKLALEVGGGQKPVLVDVTFSNCQADNKK